MQRKQSAKKWKRENLNPPIVLNDNAQLLFTDPHWKKMSNEKPKMQFPLEKKVFRFHLLYFIFFLLLNNLVRIFHFVTFFDFWRHFSICWLEKLSVLFFKYNKAYTNKWNNNAQKRDFSYEICMFWQCDIVLSSANIALSQTILLN